ncbi:MAG: NADH-quinone oxidoreductase subunit J [Candidatus Rokubacteria bacterium]|nr:NADH-quinone oxidoreductase subunit J [Candidatus Rokubacteria bacterium]
MSLEAAAFWGLALVLLASGLAVVLSKNLFHSVLYLALALVATAGLFLLLQAEFLAAVQILLYAGGVITIVVFAIVVTERLVGERLVQTNRGIVNGGLVSLAVLIAIIIFVTRATLPQTPPPPPADLTQAIGRDLLTRFVLPFELLAVLFLAALLGALFFARKEE